jgi:hypothetical protein
MVLELFRRNHALIDALSKKTPNEFFKVMEILIERARAALDEAEWLRYCTQSAWRCLLPTRPDK